MNKRHLIMSNLKVLFTMQHVRLVEIPDGHFVTLGDLLELIKVSEERHARAVKALRVLGFEPIPPQTD